MGYEMLAYELDRAPSTFQKRIEVTLMGLKDIYKLVYLDIFILLVKNILEE
jgi:hypothetical protein